MQESVLDILVLIFYKNVGEFSSSCSNNTYFAAVGISLSLSGEGKIKKASAFSSASVFLNQILYSCIEGNDHQCMRQNNWSDIN